MIRDALHPALAFALTMLTSVAALTALMALMAPVAAAQEVTVTPVLGLHQRPGRFVPIRVEVRAGAEPLRGRVLLRVDGGPDVALPVDLPANGRLDRTVPVTVQGATARVVARVDWAAPDSEPAAALRLVRPEPGQALTLTVAADDGEQREFDLLGGTNHTILACAPSSAPNRAEYLEMLDGGVLGAIPEGQLTAPAVTALSEWVHLGGQLLLTDPDLLRRYPALDHALFPPRGAEESLPPSIPGLPGHFGTALRRRGLGPRDVVYDTSGRPHHIRFNAGAGGGALLLRPLLDAGGRTAMARLLAQMAPAPASAASATVPTLSPAALSAFPPAAPGGWARSALALWLLAVPALGLLWSRRKRAGGVAVIAAGLVSGWLGVASTAPLAQVVTITTLGPAPRTEQVVHVASARAATVSIGLTDDALPRPIVRRAGELRSAQGVVVWNETPRWDDWVIARGASRAAALAPRTRPAHRLVGVQAGHRLLLSNESGIAATVCLLAWRGRLHNLGALAVGEVRNIEFPARLAGPIGVLEQVAALHGADTARALRVARARLAPTDQPLLLAATVSKLQPMPQFDGSAARRLPSVMVAPVTTGR